MYNDIIAVTNRHLCQRPFPEQIERVEFYRDGRLYDIAYDDPFTVHFLSNWQQAAVTDCVPGEHWRAKVDLADGTMVSLEEIVP